MIYSSLWLSLLAVFTQYTGGPLKANTDSSSINKDYLLQAVNDTRKKGCQCGNVYYAPAPPITWSNQLEKAAVEHSRDMNSKNYFSHTAQDGTDAGVRIDVAGYKWRTWGENIAQGYRNEAEVIQGWLKSPGHCKNMMNPAFKDMGVAKAGTYWTQDFGAK